MSENLIKLNRFTTIPFLIDMLERKKLTLLNPGFWEDFNDRETVEAYKSRINANGIYALCLTYGTGSIHHWNAFANGTSGCCIELSPEKIFGVLSKTQGVIHGKAVYMGIKNLSDFKTEQLPYFKRLPFKTEKEYRIIATSDNPQQAAFDIDIDLNVIRRITLSNKLPKPVFKSLKIILSSLLSPHKIPILHSTLFSNQIWISHFKGVEKAKQSKSQ
ncbi:hypothetical protein [Pedobacter sp. Leaf250]|uniref:hypothetical protein n=1 Tax=Pedobacter sp. Leaf250 TaxID=2876559 RepID=UPI001E416326|nr:hypothetical protein [Pedobacter sp. Leaf250]